jgi:NAD(P)-dependent dehydrogenase (short-subunit alcohol dehydrogenase family)
MILADKVVMISGVGPGMGRKMALLAAAEGARVVMGDLARQQPFLDTVAREIRAAGGTCTAVTCDVTDAQQCRDFAKAAIDAYGTIDGLINSAYINGTWALFEDADLADWKRGFEVTFWGALNMTQAVIPEMKRKRKGAIVNISSQSTVRALPHSGDYACAKTALNAATRTCARELGRYNIRVIATRMGRLWGVPYQNAMAKRAEQLGVTLDKLLDDVRAGIALGVIPPDEECAKGVMMFLSDYASMITGASIDINGGEYMTS